MHGIIGASFTYRLAFGPNAGRKALTLTGGTNQRLKSATANIYRIGDGWLIRP